MSFVISEQPRELNFHGGRQTLGPNLGPGSYDAPIYSTKK